MIEQHIKWLIGFTIIVNAGFLFAPFLSDTDPTVYFMLAKNMALHGHWLDLMSMQGGPWLDKPHFPFWVTAASFTLFGCHPWSYLLPGFLFYLLGAVYTFKLARLFYHNDTIAWLSVLMMLTALHLMLSTLDLRAEAYLIGEIMPACYYWLHYNAKTKIRYLLLGALFTGLALMTKGPFVLVTIGSGLVALWIYQKQLKSIVSIKWLAAALLSFLCAMPEFIALYAQFSVKGLQWYFYDSQFGRFLDTGKIVKHGGGYFFFVRNFLWSFLPWSIVFIAALIDRFKHANTVSSDDKKAFVYLVSSFFITFIMFTVSKFQLDYYTNIIFPFAAIVSARYLYGLVERFQKHVIVRVQVIVAVALLVVLIFLVGIASVKIQHDFIVVNVLPLLLLSYMWFSRHRLSAADQAIAYPALSITVVFIGAALVQAWLLSPYSAGYVIANYINRQKTNWPVYQYQEATNLSVYLKNSAIIVHYPQDLPLHAHYYLVMDSVTLTPALLKQLPGVTVVFKQEAVRLSKFTRRFFLPGSSGPADYQVLLEARDQS